MKGVRTHDLYNLRYQRTRDLWADNDPENARSIHCGWFRPNDQSSRTAPCLLYGTYANAATFLADGFGIPQPMDEPPDWKMGSEEEQPVKWVDHHAHWLCAPDNALQELSPSGRDLSDNHSSPTER